MAYMVFSVYCAVFVIPAVEGIYVRSEIDCDDGRKVPIMTFGPIGIAPAYKRQGFGKQLVDYSMEKAREMGAGALAITGNILFYGKSGFVPAKTKGGALCR